MFAVNQVAVNHYAIDVHSGFKGIAGYFNVAVSEGMFCACNDANIAAESNAVIVFFVMISLF